MKDKISKRLDEITTTTLIVGIDIAKATHWARFVDCRAREVGRVTSFTCDLNGFESIITKIKDLCNNKTFDDVIVGMEPTGHYWKTLAHYLMNLGYRVVCVNPYHTKKAKELDDNSQTASDKKDAMTIARLIKDGRFFEPYLPQDVYAELRVLTNARSSVIRKSSSVKNMITAMLDEYFPEMCTVFKNPLKGKASRQVLKICPFPSLILAMGESVVLEVVKKAVKKTVGIKKICELMKVAKTSVGVDYGIESAKMRLDMLLDELELSERHLADIEMSISVRKKSDCPAGATFACKRTEERMLNATGYADKIISVKGIGVVTAASFLGEVGDPLRFNSARANSQLRRI